MAKNTNTFEHNQTLRALDAIPLSGEQAQLLKDKYYALKKLVQEMQEKAELFERSIFGIVLSDKTKRVDEFYSEKLKDLKESIRSFLIAVEDTVPEALARGMGKPVILEIPKNKKEKYVLTVVSMRADKLPTSTWNPEQMTLQYFAQSGDFFSRGYVAGEVQKYKYWFSIKWADDLVKILLPQYEAQITTR